MLPGHPIPVFLLWEKVLLSLFRSQISVHCLPKYLNHIKVQSQIQLLGHFSLVGTAVCPNVSKVMLP